MELRARVEAIKECRGALSELSWLDAQLVLGQAGFEPYDPAGDEWVEGEYFQDVLKNGSTEQLLSLRNFLRDDSAHHAHSRPSNRNSLTVFVSHISTFKDYAGQVQTLLNAIGIESFVAHVDIQPSAEWRKEIKEVLRTCHALVALLHAGFHESQWCDQEVGWALGRGIPILAFQEKTMPDPGGDGFLEERQHQQLGTAWQVMPRILSWLVGDAATRGLAIEPLAKAFETSYSYDHTRQLVGILRTPGLQLPRHLWERIIAASHTNDEVNNCYVAIDSENTPVPEHLKTLASEAGFAEPDAYQPV